MPHRKTFRRLEITRVPRFITFSCYQSLPLLGNPRIRDRLMEELTRRSVEHAIRMHAWVIMPDHVHMIAETSDAPMSVLLQASKGAFAHDVIARWRELDAPILAKITDSSGRARLWQRGGGFDRVVRVNAELEEKIRYIHANPVRKGLCETPSDWRWSSASRGMDLQPP